MDDLSHKDNALAYLAEIYSADPADFRAFPFTKGWVCTRILSPKEIARGQSLGLTHLVVESESGKVFQYPSWSQPMVASAHQRFLETGQNTGGRQVYPAQRTLIARKTSETDQSVEYELTIRSQTDETHPETTHPLTLQKDSYLFAPTDSMSALATARIRWMHDQDNGTWPQTMETTQ